MADLYSELGASASEPQAFARQGRGRESDGSVLCAARRLVSGVLWLMRYSDVELFAEATVGEPAFGHAEMPIEKSSCRTSRPHSRSRGGQVDEHRGL